MIISAHGFYLIAGDDSLMVVLRKLVSDFKAQLGELPAAHLTSLIHDRRAQWWMTLLSRLRLGYFSTVSHTDST